MEIIMERKEFKWLSECVYKRFIAVCIVTVFFGWLQNNTLKMMERMPEINREVADINGVSFFSESIAELEYFNRKIEVAMEKDTGSVNPAVNIEHVAVVNEDENVSDRYDAVRNDTVRKDTVSIDESVKENNIADSDVVNENITDMEAIPQVPTWTVTLYGNGGVPESDVFTWEGETISLENREVPYRLGKEFRGWYLDAACTTPFTGVDNQNTEVSLYAGWKEIDGVACDDNGYIVSCEPGSVVDGLLAVPSHTSCTGIENGAFSSVEDMVEELYIPSNITYIAPGALDVLTNLLYIEVASGNPVYYSNNGNLYKNDGTLIK